MCANFFLLLLLFEKWESRWRELCWPTPNWGWSNFCLVQIFYKLGGTGRIQSLPPAPRHATTWCSFAVVERLTSRSRDSRRFGVNYILNSPHRITKQKFKNKINKKKNSWQFFQKYENKEICQVFQIYKNRK